MGDASVQAWRARAESALARVAALEEERARSQRAMADLAGKLAAFESAERALRAELRSRDARFGAISEMQDRWERKLQGLMDLKERLEALLAEESGFEVA